MGEIVWGGSVLDFRLRRWNYVVHICYLPVFWSIDCFKYLLGGLFEKSRAYILSAREMWEWFGGIWGSEGVWGECCGL